MTVSCPGASSLCRQRAGAARAGQVALQSSRAALALRAAALRRLRKIRHSRGMLDRDPDPAPAAPFVSSVMRVEPGWIDHNSHLNMAYYNVLFDRAVDEVYEVLGLGLNYVETTGHSTFTAEVHVRYLRELHAGDPVRVSLQLLDFDAKRLHYFEQLMHAEAGWLSATSENMALHVDMAARKTAAFGDAVAARLRRMKAAHAALPVPDGVGRRIAMPGTK
jgi:acyl-CoA thioester hydrolase